MPRYILIDNSSGFIFGDTAGFDRQSEITTPTEAARELDEHIGVAGREYVEHASPRPSATGYRVYGAGHELSPVVDGQDEETIRAVIKQCDYVAFVECVECQ